MPSKKAKDAKRLKQTTLFDSPISKRNPKQHSSPSFSTQTIKKESTHSSDDGGIHLGAVALGSSDEEDMPSPSKRTHKRHPICLASESSSEEPYPPAQVAPTIQIDIGIEDLVPRKRRRLRRRSSEVGADEDIDQLVNEVDEEGVFVFLFTSVVL